MGFDKSYFAVDPSAPSDLIVTTQRRVCFEEVDMLGIVWHGHYVSYLDAGRVAFGDRFPTLSYQKMMEESLAAPIVQLHIDYHASLFFDGVMEIETTLHWTDALRLNFSYKISSGGRLAVKAYTVQLFTNLQGVAVLVPPVWIDEFREQWKTGLLR